MDEKTFKQDVYPILVLTMVVCISVIALSIVNDITRDRIDDSKQQKINEMLAEQFPEMDRSRYREDIDVHIIYTDDAIIGYAFMITASGYGGPIEILVALENSTLVGEDIIIRSIVIIANSETPGLGDRITTPAFLDQFRGIGVEDVRLKDEGGRIDAITGATVSTRAVVSSVHGGVLEKTLMITGSPAEGV